MVPDTAMCTVMTSPNHRHIHTHTRFHSPGLQHGVTQGNRQVGHTHTQKKYKPVPYMFLVYTGNTHNLSFSRLTFCNGHEFQISQIHNSNHTHEAVMHTQCHTARWTVTYATPVTYTDMARDTQPPSHTPPSCRPSPIGTMRLQIQWQWHAELH